MIYLKEIVKPFAEWIEQKVFIFFSLGFTLGHGIHGNNLFYFFYYHFLFYGW